METNNPSSQQENKEFTFSYFNTLWSKESTLITLQEFHRQVTSALWKPTTEAYRRLKALSGRDNDAATIKSAMPVVIVEGVCRPRCSHAAANLESLNGLAMFDMDHCALRTPEIKAILRHLPYVAYAHTSISGEGLKIIVRLDARTPAEYPLAYAICRQTLERLAGHPCDGQCARITQPCSCVWDTEAYYNPGAEAYPWREELEVDPSLGQLVAATGYAYAPGGGNSNYSYGNGYGSSKASPLPPATPACGYIEAFVRTFFQYHPWQKGNRHESMLALGRSARRKGFSKEELGKLTSVMAAQIVGSGYTQKELEKDLSTGYQYVDLSYNPQEAPDLLSELSTVTFTSCSQKNEEEEKEELSIKNEAVRSVTPTIPDEVYDVLPGFLKKALTVARSTRERDTLLLGILANLSGCMPHVRVTYDQRPYSPHLYMLFLAPSAAGKGVLTLAGMLPEAINNYLKGENKRKKEIYERELKAWEDSHKSPHAKQALQARTSSRTSSPSPASSSSFSSSSSSAAAPSLSPSSPSSLSSSSSSYSSSGSSSALSPAPSSMPEEPEYYILCGAPNTSKTQLIRRLKINGDLGLIINATELDMISGAIKQDYGKHDDVFRAAFHHEKVSTDYKTDNQMICAETPRLALNFCGTPNQLITFIRSLEGGLFTRFCTYTYGARWHFRSAAPIKGQQDYFTLYKELSQQVLDMFLFFQQSPTEVVLTDSQWAEHTAYFERLLDEVASEKADAPGSIVLRAGLIAVRIASILTALRKAESAFSMKEYTCTDEDFHSAMEIVKTTTSHGLLVLSSLPGEEVKAKPLTTYFRLRPIIEQLPKIFTYKEVRDKALSQGISESSTCRYLKNLLNLKYLDNQDGKYRVIKKFTGIS